MRSTEHRQTWLAANRERGDGGEANPINLVERVAARHVVKFLLDIAWVTPGSSDLVDLLLVVATASANIGHLGRDPATNARYARLDRLPPDGLRRPISINALALSLNLPFETVRRRALALAARGVFAYAPSGVYVRAAAFEHEAAVVGFRRRYDCLWRLRAEMESFGLVAPCAIAPPPADDPAAPVAGVNRLVSDFWLRCLEEVRTQMRDPLTGLIYLGILRANVEHLFTDEVALRTRAGQPVDEEGRPVRMSDLARQLGVPYETTRRHVAWLVAHGFCLRDADGLRYPPAVVTAPEAIKTAATNLANLQRLFRQTEELLVATAPTAEPPASLGQAHQPLGLRDAL
jgi:hypothetical protein